MQRARGGAVQSGQTWGVRSVALGQASSTDCRESGAVLREAGSVPAIQSFSVSALDAAVPLGQGFYQSKDR